MNENESKTATCGVSWCNEPHVPDEDWFPRLADGAISRSHSLELRNAYVSQTETITEDGSALGEIRIHIDALREGYSLEDAQSVADDLMALIAIAGATN